MDESGTIGRLYEVRATPTTFYLDEDGVVAAIQIGFVTQEWIELQVGG